MLLNQTFNQEINKDANVNACHCFLLSGTYPNSKPKIFVITHPAKMIPIGMAARKPSPK